MKNKATWWMISAIAVVVFAAGLRATAQAPMPTHFRGLINDYTPATIGGKLVGPWVMNGTWSLDLNDHATSADFSAEMTMGSSDYAVVNGVVKDPDSPDPQVRTAHTHHITMTGAMVSFATGMCPSYFPPGPATTNPGFMISGPAKITGNGSAAPFSKNNTVLSMLTVCVTGGTDVPFSNVTLVFGAPASGHFGTQAIHGVVRKSRLSNFEDGHDGDHR